jgi:ABC-type sugar transport system ATPase subunit
MNILPCEIRQVDSGYKLVFEGLDIDVDESIVSNIVKAGYPAKILLGIRPDYITLQAEQASASYPAEVAVSELLGSEAIVSLRVGKSIVKAKADSARAYEIGERVYFSFPTDKIKFFDPDSQQHVQL